MKLLFFAAKPDLGLIWISKSLENATARPVGTKHEEFGLRLIGSFNKAIKSIPDAPDVLYEGNFTSEDNLLINTLTINLIDYLLFELSLPI